MLYKYGISVRVVVWGRSSFYFSLIFWRRTITRPCWFEMIIAYSTPRVSLPDFLRQYWRIQNDIFEFCTASMDLLRKEYRKFHVGSIMCHEWHVPWVFWKHCKLNWPVWVTQCLHVDQLTLNSFLQLKTTTESFCYISFSYRCRGSYICSKFPLWFSECFFLSHLAGLWGRFQYSRQRVLCCRCAAPGTEVFWRI